MTARRMHPARRWLVGGLGLLALLALAVLGAARLGAFAGHAPADLGVVNGRLRPPSATPNSVSSQADLHPGHPQQAYARIEALSAHSPSAQAALDRLERALAQIDGVVITQRGTDTLYAEAHTRWLGFVDDLEFWFDPERQVLDVRSASRLGRRDFGVNRERVQAIRAAYQSCQP